MEKRKRLKFFIYEDDLLPSQKIEYRFQILKLLQEHKNGLSLKEGIEKEAVYRINFCKNVTKLAIPKLIKKLPEGVELDKEKIDNLTKVFPLQYLSMFEHMRRNKLR